MPQLGGRPKGAKDKFPRQTAARKQAESALSGLSARGRTPLSIMLEDMEAKYESGDLSAAATRAETCAPYVHARLASTVVTHRDALDDLSVDDLRRLLAHAEHTARSIGHEIEGEAEPEIAGEPD